MSQLSKLCLAASVQAAFQAMVMEGEVKKGNLTCMLSCGHFRSDKRRKGGCVCISTCTI